MKPPWIKVRRKPTAEPSITHIIIWVSNGLFMGGIDFYCPVNDLHEIGKALKSFPRSVPDEYYYEYGGDDQIKEHSWQRYFLMRAFTKDRRGRCAIQVIIDLKQEVPENGYCEFCIHVVEVAQLNRLGNLFHQLYEHERGEFHWNNNSAQIFEDYQEIGEDTFVEIPIGFPLE